MKKLLITVVIAALFLPAMSWAAGSVTQTLDRVQNNNTAILTFAWTGDASDGSVPSTATSTDITAAIKGMGIIEVRTTPGVTAPTTLYDIVLNNPDGLDLMGGALANLSATIPGAVQPLMPSTDPSPRVVDGVLTMVLTNNSVNSAIGTVKVILRR